MLKSASIVALVTALALTACQSTAPAGGDANALLCGSLQQLDTAVAAVKSLSNSSTVDQVRTAANDVKTAWASVSTAAQSVRDIQLDDTKAAYEEIESSLATVSDPSTLSQAVTRAQAAVTRFETASNVLNRTVCRGTR